MKLAAFDLETTGVDVDTCEVVQAAVVFAHVSPVAHIDLGGSTSFVEKFYAVNIPAGSTAVHGLRDEDVADCPPFSKFVRGMFKSLTCEDVIAVSFNGCGYDIPVVCRYLAGRDGRSRTDYEALLRSRHVDVMRLWWRVKANNELAPWQTHTHVMMSSEDPDGQETVPALTAEMFAGSLVAVHGFYLGEGFDGAHDAGEDCRATLRVLAEMLKTGDVPDLETAIKWSNQPLPGFVDFDGKFRWDGDQCILTIGTQAGTPVENVDRGFLRWMLGKDFGAGTKRVARLVLDGGYPERKYEDEGAN